jgi:hypothetical protein
MESNIGHVEQKLCRKGLHWYPVTDKRCKECHKITKRKWRQANPERVEGVNERMHQENGGRLILNLDVNAQENGAGQS